MPNLSATENVMMYYASVFQASDMVMFKSWSQVPRNGTNSDYEINIEYFKKATSSSGLPTLLPSTP
jgi:hypothetical protein